MIRKIPIRYYETSSLLIRLNPVVKLVWLILLSAQILLFNNIHLEILLFLLVLLLFRISKINLLTLQGSKFAIITAGLIGLIQVIFNREGIPLFSIFGLNITRIGMIKAVFISTRFLSFILLGYLFVITTEPNAFVYSLMRIGLPYRIGFSLITALRLIPVFSNEAHNIFYAQVTRGVNYRLFPIGRFMGNVSQFLKVLLISMLKKVDALVLSMEGRSFGIQSRRSFTRKAEFSLVDKSLLLLACLMSLFLIFWGREVIL
jgi:energy-coupling factor transport system permease protein